MREEAMRGDCRIVRVQEGWWAHAAAMAVRLHEYEGGSQLDAAATPFRAAAYLRQRIQDDMGACLVALDPDHNSPVGVIVVEWDVWPARGHGLASGLWCDPGAPRMTAWQLMLCGALELEAHGVSEVLISARHPRNQDRRTYRRMGFRSVYADPEGNKWYRAPLATVLRVTEERFQAWAR